MPGPLPWTGSGILKRQQLTIPRVANDDPYAEQFRAIERWANNLGVWKDITDNVQWSQAATISRASASSVSWTQYGNTIICIGKLIATSAGTAGNLMQITGLPWTEYSNNTESAGFGRFYDASVPLNYTGGLAASGSGFSPTFYFLSDNSTGSGFGLNPAVTIAIADEFHFTYIFRAG